MNIICDIDGTLCRPPNQRLQLLAAGRWEDFSAGSNTQDVPVRPIIHILQLLYQRGLQIHLHTGRGEAVRATTEDWLWNYNVPFQRLLMRPEGDKRPDYLVKWDYIKKNGYSPATVFCVFEDRDKCVALYRQLGYLCLQVAKDAGIDTQKASYAQFRTAAACLTPALTFD